ncbi:MAG: transposase [Rhodospirillales bacterium]|nr:transposase [Rhodospirillales bacterium]
MIRTFKFRLRPNRAQAEALDVMLWDCCALYNACLEQRIDAYRRRGISLRYSNQASELKAVREAEPALARWSFTTLQQVLRRLEKTYVAFFRRGHGFPRFRSRARFDSADMRAGDGLTIRKTGRIGVVGIPGQIKVVWHREMPGCAKLGHAVISRKAGKWFICFQVEFDATGPVRTGPVVGIDLGLNNLIATSDGQTIPAPRFARKAQKALRRAQRALARCRRGSNRRRKAKARIAAASARVANQRRDFAHKLSRYLADRYSLIAFENLNLSGLKRGMLARSVHDAAWSQIVSFTQYKAEGAGAAVVLVDPNGTSQTCPDCGTVTRKPLSQRRHICDCGCDLDRDVAASRIVLQRATSPGGTPGRMPSQRVAA